MTSAGPLEAVLKRTASNNRAAQIIAQEAEASRSSVFQAIKNRRLVNVDKTKFQPLIAPFAGFVAAFTEITVTFPTEYCKVQLQLNRHNKNFDLFKHLKERGLKIYQGLPPMLIGAPIQGLLRFSCLDYVLHSATLNSMTESPAMKGLVAGVIAGTVESIVVVTPMETVKTKLIDSNMNLFQGVRMVVEKQGVRGLYNGLGPTIAKSATNQAIRFVVFNQYKHYICGTVSTCDSTKKLTILQSLTGGILAGLVGALLNTPIDTVKSRMQGLGASEYKNSIDCVKKMVRDEGVLSLYKGLLWRAARVVPGQGIIFVVYDQVSTKLNEQLKL